MDTLDQVWDVLGHWFDRARDAASLIPIIYGAAWDVIQEWAYAHEEQADLFTVWALVLGLLYLTYVKLNTWDVLRHQRDRTILGRTMKAQKLSEAVLFLTLGALYGASLYLYYAKVDLLGFWDRMGIRAVLIGAILTAAFFGRRFKLTLRSETTIQRIRRNRTVVPATRSKHAKGYDVSHAPAERDGGRYSTEQGPQ